MCPDSGRFLAGLPGVFAKGPFPVLLDEERKGDDRFSFVSGRKGAAEVSRPMEVLSQRPPVRNPAPDDRGFQENGKPVDVGGRTGKVSGVERMEEDSSPLIHETVNVVRMEGVFR